MDENERREHVELLDKDSFKFLSDLAFKIKTNQGQWVNDMLSIIEEKPEFISNVNQYREGKDKSESLLHVAIKYEEDQDIIKRILHLCPDLLILAQESSDKYRGQTPLHIAITKGQYKLTKLILKTSVQQEKSRKMSSKGSSGLHLSLTPTHFTTFSMVHSKATGRIFANTVMMAELPLSVAALSFNERIVDLLIKYGADINSKNSSGDTVLHSLAKYAAMYPDNIDNVISMLHYFNSKFEENVSQPFRVQDHTDPNFRLCKHSYAWFVQNKDHLTPLQLSAKLGVVAIFRFIIKLENVYYFQIQHDGLFDIKFYDITEIDTLSKLQGAKRLVRNQGFNCPEDSENTNGEAPRRGNVTKYPGCTPLSFSKFNYSPTDSILEMMFAYDYQSGSAFRIIETSPVKNIIIEKWKKIRIIYYIWGLIHLFLMISLTAEAVIRSDLYASNSVIRLDVLSSSYTYYYNGTPNNTITLGGTVPESSKRFADVQFYISFLIGDILYGFLVLLLLMAKIQRPNALRYIFHNMFHLLFLCIFCLSLLIDFAMTLSDCHDKIALTIALVTGWLFFIFFLQATYLFGHFTELMRRVIFGDLLRFSVLVTILLVSFTAGIYITFIGKRNFESYDDLYYFDYDVTSIFNGYGGTLLKLFKLMLGMDFYSRFDFRNARLPWLATTLYILFVILTYFILTISLIAMMVQTWAVLWKNRFSQWRLQQLSVILFIEDLFCLPCIQAAFKLPTEKRTFSVFDPETKQNKEIDRFYLKLNSLERTYATEEDRQALRRSRLEDVLSRLDKSLQSTEPSLFGTCSGKLRYESESHSKYIRKSSKVKGKNRATKIEIDPDKDNRTSKQTYTSYHSDASFESIPEPVE